MEKLQEAPSFGVAQQQKLTELLDEIREFHFSVSIDDFDSLYVFALAVRDLVLQLQALAAPILPATIVTRLESIHVDVQDFLSASSARAELDALVPVIDDALQGIDRHPGTLLPRSLRQLLEERNLDPVSEEIQRALNAAESDPPVAITAARSALEALLKVYIQDKELPPPKRPKTDNLLKAAMSDLGLDPADKVDTDVRRVLQSLSVRGESPASTETVPAPAGQGAIGAHTGSMCPNRNAVRACAGTVECRDDFCHGLLWSIVHGIASLRTIGGSAHGHGRRSYRLQARHAGLAVQSAQAFIEFFVETWNYHERRRLTD